jgi:hypothetical protein
MTVINTFVLIGTILSHDNFFSTVEFNLNPGTNGGPAIAILPNSAIPCTVEPGRVIYIVKEEDQKTPIISCEAADEVHP